MKPSQPAKARWQCLHHGGVMTTIGEGYRWAEPGELATASCHHCGATCHIKRNVNGPTSWVQAVAKRKILHDAICCPHEGSDWHDQLVRLNRAIAQCVSPRVRALMEQDRDDLLSAVPR